jgi:hypothetical protein
MTTRSRIARRAPLALAGILYMFVLIAPAGAAAKTVTAKLRVLTPTRVLDPGTTYVLGRESVRTDPNADCLGAGGTGARIAIPKPTGLGLLAAGASARGSLRPLSVSDGSGFGIAVCGIGGVEAGMGTFWYFKRNHTELSVGVDQEPMRRGDELLAYLAPDNFPAPNPDELELRAPARVVAGQPFQVTVLERGCVTESNPPFTTTCATAPAAGVQVSGAGGPSTTGADGTATLTAPDRKVRLRATRGADIPSEALKVCVSEQLSDCPPVRGERIRGRSVRDRIKGTRGADAILARGGRDLVDLRKGGPDKVRCGAGRDTVLGKRRDDRVARDCERIRRR